MIVNEDIKALAKSAYELAQLPEHERAARKWEAVSVCGQLVSADLHFRFVDLVLLVRLPELVNPAEAVIGLEHGLRQTLEQVLRLGARFRR